jgi:EAL domain-containing protein (putative c-di-GMP-specific phosphodiesterase class I)
MGLAHSLNIKVIAEGVETPEELAFLKEHECYDMQGPLFGKPVSAEGMAEVFTKDFRSVLGSRV